MAYFIPLTLPNIIILIILPFSPNRVHGGVPEQGPDGALPLEDVPSERVRGRRHLPRHPSEPLEPDLRRLGHPHVDPVAAGRAQPEQPGQLGGRAAVPGEPARVREEGGRHRRAVVAAPHGRDRQRLGPPRQVYEADVDSAALNRERMSASYS